LRTSVRSQKRKNIASITSSGTCAVSQIRDDHAAYLDHWLKVLKEDKSAIFSGAARA
jgi:antirestriction protein ArdC